MFNETHLSGISLYIHLPFCESLCTYCGCNTRITVNHNVEFPYISSLLKEWELYYRIFGQDPKLKEIHLGGGTPTFFSPKNLGLLIGKILKKACIPPNREFGFEAHPNNTTTEHLQVLYDLGFSRLSLGIQDFDPVVQKTINRIQSFEVVRTVTDNARKIGYSSINFDLIYGLPRQTKKSIESTIEKVAQLMPDRIAFYSYAHVPWKKPGQRMFTKLHLPQHEEKRAIYELGKQMLQSLGYVEIGLDHFALKSDDLFRSAVNGTLHRNFMGYTTSKTKLVVGLGVSAIGDTESAYGQNEKQVEKYKKIIADGELPIYKGHVLNPEEKIMRKHILNLMCKLKTSWHEDQYYLPHLRNVDKYLKEHIKDGIVTLSHKEIEITEKGRAFIRNVCMAIDPKICDLKNSQIYSATI
ncbi:MAG: coproporphyrinogen-III oxidase [Cyclobacteriaceae bacterium]|nr:MAG: coproporphyrinogen-III oxidase [Cyclobacteriaceae bacterium]